MTLRLVDAGWGAELAQALKADTSALRVICPFIKLRALERLLALSPECVQVITRFNLDDFSSGVSDIAALRRVLAAGGQVRAVSAACTPSSTCSVPAAPSLPRPT